MDYANLIEHWRAAGVKLNPPATEAEVRETFSALGKPVSQDVVDLFTHVNGFANDCDGLWDFWSLERMREDGPSGSELVFFADWLIVSHCYGFRYENAEVSSVYVDYGTWVAGSVAEFFEKYLRCPCDVDAHCLGEACPYANSPTPRDESRDMVELRST